VAVGLDCEEKVAVRHEEMLAVWYQERLVVQERGYH
jgi:hypothetical protein